VSAFYAVSTALVIVAILTSGASFVFWGVFDRDVPMTVGNIRGTALAMFVIAVPVLIGSMIRSLGGSLTARFVCLGNRRPGPSVAARRVTADARAAGAADAR